MDFFDALGDVLGSDSTYSARSSSRCVLLFAAIGEWVAERAGTLNISVEGMLLAGAFGAALGMHWLSAGAVGLSVGCAAGGSSSR